MSKDTVKRIEGRIRTIARYRKMIEEMERVAGKSIVLDVHIYDADSNEVSKASNGANKELFTSFVLEQIKSLEKEIEGLRELEKEERCNHERVYHYLDVVDLKQYNICLDCKKKVEAMRF